MDHPMVVSKRMLRKTFKTNQVEGLLLAEYGR